MQIITIIILAGMCLYFLFEARKYEKISFNLAEKYIKERSTRQSLEQKIIQQVDSFNEDEFESLEEIEE